jgi:hypothetical protein
VLISPGEIDQPTEPTEPTEPTRNPEINVYDDCGTRKLCFGFPLTCIKTRDCELFGAVIHDDDEKFFFELLSVRKFIK